MNRIPALDDIPREFNVHLMPNVANPRAVHSSRGVGEPPLLLAGAVLFALRDAAMAARRETTTTSSDTSSPPPPLLASDAPLTSERLRMACLDDAALLALAKHADPASFRAKGSF
jgi:xanthine dehydrogenase/oxidase